MNLYLGNFNIMQHIIINYQYWQSLDWNSVTLNNYLPKEGHQVMFTERKQVDILDDNHLVVVLIKYSIV